ncbi:MAG TPA: hypothetical protein VFW05_07600 [Verrucomicrobiae bacterium]|nr:hypothetical protein [Verrucomicrobiae bacterium]
MFFGAASRSISARLDDGFSSLAFALTPTLSHPMGEGESFFVLGRIFALRFEGVSLLNADIVLRG